MVVPAAVTASTESTVKTAAANGKGAAVALPSRVASKFRRGILTEFHA